MPTGICTLVRTGGEIGPTWIHKPFSLLELRSDKTWEAIQVTQANIQIHSHIILAFDLMWKYIIVIFGQTLSDPEYARVLKDAQRYAWGFTCQAINTQWWKLQFPPQILIGIIMTLSTSGKGIIF